MGKSKTVYTCQKCGSQSPKWLGKCPDCNEWHSYVEETFGLAAPLSGPKSAGAKPQSLADIDSEQGAHIPTGITELDRVLGGGYVPGSAVLIGGDPGIGKSTLLLQTFARLAEQGKKVLYVSGEESASQIKARADRLNIATESLFVLTENNLELLLGLLKREKIDLLAVDSVQTVYSDNLTSAPGTVSQVRECCGQIIQNAKKTNLTTFFIGHVTKEGAIAGPKVLEHMVDTVLYFESDQGHTYRIVRSVKNRFGATNEIGVFEMLGSGLTEVANPSHLFLAEREKNVAGSAVVASLEGTRPLLLEVQSLVTHSGLANPRRTAIGIDSGRLALLVAVLEKIVGITLGDQDIFVNVAGGLKMREPALDLGVATALFSSFRNLSISPDTLLIGEVGLTGEVRAVQHLDIRLREGSKLGFKKALIPKASGKSKPQAEGIKLIQVRTLEEAVHTLF